LAGRFNILKEQCPLRSKFITVSALAVAGTLSAWAQTQKIAVIDMQGAILQTKEGQKASAELKTKFSPKEAEFTKRGQDLATKQEQYRKAANTMSDDAKAAADRDMQTGTRNLQRDTDDAKADFQTEENRLLGGIMGKMQAVLTKYANDNQITLIVDISTQPNNLLFADQSANVTAAIIGLYDKGEAAGPALSAPAPNTPGPAKTPPATPSPRKPAAPAPK
jgi:outer membrane protein